MPSSRPQGYYSMRLLRFIPIQLTLLLLLGIVLGNYIDFGVVVPLISTVVLLVALGFLFYIDFAKTTAAFALITAMLTLSIGVMAISLSNPKNLPGYYVNVIRNGSATFHLKITEALKPTAFSNRYIAIKIMDVSPTETTNTSFLIFMLLITQIYLFSAELFSAI